MKKLAKFLSAFLLLVLVLAFEFLFTGPNSDPEGPVEPEPISIREEGTYTAKDDVALYLFTYHHLPENFVSKEEAEKLGREAKKGNLWDVCDHCSIGGDRFGNYEELLPERKGRKYYECDIDYHGGSRNGKRIVYSSDGLIYYTDDHYESFTLLYGEEE